MYISPDWVQAIASALLVGLTAATLIVLWGYARDTKMIAGAAEDSAEAAKSTIEQIRKISGIAGNKLSSRQRR